MLSDVSYLLQRALVKMLNPKSVRASVINRRAHIGSGVQFVNSSVDEYSYIGPNSIIIKTKIGKYCSIASDVRIGLAEHPMNLLSTSSIFFDETNVLGKGLGGSSDSYFRRTTIGNDVWIGCNCMIKGGSTISDGAVIGMGSILTKDVGPYEIWAGNPARMIRKRFSDEEIFILLKHPWWGKKPEEMLQYVHRPCEYIKMLKDKM